MKNFFICSALFLSALGFSQTTILEEKEDEIVYFTPKLINDNKLLIPQGKVIKGYGAINNLLTFDESGKKESQLIIWRNYHVESPFCL